MANLNISTWYTDSVQWTAVAAWIQNHAYTCGQLVRQLATPAVGSERVFVCGVAGTSNNVAEPTWVITRYGATTDGTVTWYEVTGNAATNGDLTNALTWTQQHTSSTAVTTGLIIYDVTSASLQVCTTSGTISASSPSFSATAGVVTSDGATVKWTSLGLASVFQYWKAPFARLQSAVASTWGASGNQFFVGNDHAETQAVNMTVTVPVTNNSPLTSSIICVDHTTNLPPVSANVTTGASLATTGANTLTITGSTSGSYEVNGISFSAGSGAVNSAITINSATGAGAEFDNCAFIKAGTTQTNGAMFINGNLIFSNVTLKVGNIGDLVCLQNATIIWRNTPNAISGTPPTVLFNLSSGVTITGVLQCEGVDFSAITGTIFAAAGNNTALFHARLIDCNIASAATVIAAGSSPATFIDVLFSGSSAVTYGQQRFRGQGSLTQSISVVRQGGASLNGTAIAWQVTTSANLSFLNRFECPSAWYPNATTGSTVNVNLYGVWFGAALPNNDQIWHDVQYFGSASSPLASTKSGTKANSLATSSAWAADTSTWDSAASAWIANHAYSLGAIISGSSVGNSGRVFICTTAGTSTNGAAPVAFASAIDGGSVTDSGAHWQAGWRFKMTVALSSPTPQLAGYLYSYVKAALPSSTFYVDPLIVLN